MKYTLILFSLFAFSISLSAQEYQSNQSESSMKVSGTSTLHDWHMDVESFTAKASLNGESLENARFTAEVKSMKSGTSSMDDNTYEAMKEEDYPRISFQSSSISGKEGKLTIKGNLTIAGVTKPITMNTTLEKWAEKSMTVKGKYTFKMSEFGIDPPRAMLGTIRTGDEITIDFNLVLYK
ncbi:YceI family protein [Cryomorpha ignava]|uniref:YceI family protein n=1 Tax=Cryomorpha ignava TaxID=101383 RepID=A0A7K3WQ32_9FLAO|nr:YceI family protein [Cryomorpha ignava]NEN23131.1 YceI family protein [Cryomorpha ignava]